MSGEEQKDRDETRAKKLTAAEKHEEYITRIKRTLVGCFLGIITGAISYLVVAPSEILGLNSYTFLALFIMLAGVVIQRHIFMFMRLGSAKLEKKDWLYQGFMTFAFWFITWSILLTTYVQ